MAEHSGQIPCHIAIIMDGNGRWAKRRGLPRTAGHAAGAEAFLSQGRHLRQEWQALVDFCPDYCLK